MRVRNDSGQAAALVMMVAAALGAVLMVAVAAVGEVMVDRTRAQTIADATALASLAGGRAAAEQLADVHGATLLSWSAGPTAGDVTVTVRLGEATATARASDAP